MEELEITSLYNMNSIRYRAEEIFKLAMDGKLDHFHLDIDKLSDVTKLVANTCKSSYPDLDIPCHSRWRHFEVIEGDLYSQVIKEISRQGKFFKLKKQVELAIISSLLDAGAGRDWSYEYERKLYTRSEGLAIAVLNMYCNGIFSVDNISCVIDAEKLACLTVDELSVGFCHLDDNPLVGIDKRCSLLNDIGKSLKQIGNNIGVFDGIFSGIEIKDHNSIDIEHVFNGLVMFLTPLIPGTMIINNIHIGDVGQHDLLINNHNAEGLVPFHKLIQWVCYSLVEPFEEYGMSVKHTELLTGLPEYRNGGLFTDLGVVCLNNEDNATQTWGLTSTFVVEWRCLTVSLLDKLRYMVQDSLKIDLTMSMLLQGGSWQAGRNIAKEMRLDGRAPFDIGIQGTIF